MIIPNIFRVGDNIGHHSTGIPWKMIAPHEKQANKNHSQTLRTLHDRGGLTWCEALAVLQDRPWRPEPDAKALVLKAVAQWDPRLARIKAFVTDPARMEAWDTWRRYIAEGGTASWPRDAFESLLSWIEEECGE